jgi:hypothetical protein
MSHLTPRRKCTICQINGRLSGHMDLGLQFKVGNHTVTTKIRALAATAKRQTAGRKPFLIISK